MLSYFCPDMIAIGTSSSVARVTSRSSSAKTGGCAVAQTTTGLTTEVTSGSKELLAVAKAAATEYGGADGRDCDNAARATANPRFLSALHLHFVLSALGPCLHTILRGKHPTWDQAGRVGEQQAEKPLLLTVEAVGLVVARLLSLLSKAVHARGGVLGAPLVDSDATSIHDILQVCKLCFSTPPARHFLSFH